MRFVPALGLLLASPVVYQAVLGQRPVAHALVFWLLAMLLALTGVLLWRAATRPPETTPLPVAPSAPRRRAQDRA